jgi:hypothetical protein
VANDHGDDVVAVLIPDELRVPEVVDQETQSAEDRLLIEQRTLPARVESLLRAEALTAWRSFARFKLFPMLESVTGKTAKRLNRDLHDHEHLIDSTARAFAEQVIFQGFDFALTRYAEQIKHVPELADWHRKRTDGGDVGRRTSTSRSEKQAQRIRDTWASMEADGKKVTNDIVATACGCSVSTVNRAFKNKPAKPTKG